RRQNRGTGSASRFPSSQWTPRLHDAPQKCTRRTLPLKFAREIAAYMSGQLAASISRSIDLATIHSNNAGNGSAPEWNENLPLAVFGLAKYRLQYFAIDSADTSGLSFARGHNAAVPGPFADPRKFCFFRNRSCPTN